MTNRKIVVVIADIGAPVALYTFLNEFPEGFPIPIVVLQSSEIDLLEISSGALTKTIPLVIVNIEKRTLLSPGHVYVVSPSMALRLNLLGDFFEVFPSDVHDVHQALTQNIAAFTEAYGDCLTTVILSGMGDREDIDRCSRILESSGVRILVLHRSEAIVFEMGERFLELNANAVEMTARQISQVLTQSGLKVSPATSTTA